MQRPAARESEDARFELIAQDRERESAVLGLVGAGGIGVALDTALNLLYWDQVSVVLAAIFVVVILAEIVVTTVRARVL